VKQVGWTITGLTELAIDLRLAARYAPDHVVVASVPGARHDLHLTATTYSKFFAHILTSCPCVPSVSKDILSHALYMQYSLILEHGVVSTPGPEDWLQLAGSTFNDASNRPTDTSHIPPAISN